jgi:hypothetical protein
MDILSSIFSNPLPKDHLYLDPGSGSFLLQGLLAALLGGAYLTKVYWKKIKTLFKRQENQDPPEEIETEKHEDD